MIPDLFISFVISWVLIIRQAWFPYSIPDRSSFIVNSLNCYMNSILKYDHSANLHRSPMAQISFNKVAAMLAYAAVAISAFAATASAQAPAPAPESVSGDSLSLSISGTAVAASVLLSAAALLKHWIEWFESLKLELLYFSPFYVWIFMIHSSSSSDLLWLAGYYWYILCILFISE